MWPSMIGRNKAETQTLPASEPCPLESHKLELLSAMDIMRDLAEEEVKELMDATPMRTVRKGTMLFGGDDGPEVLFLLKSGRIELSRQPPEGKKLILGFVESGTFFGEMSLIGQRLVGTCAVAVEDSVICALSRHDVESLILDHPKVAFRVIEVLAQRLQQTRDSLEEMAFNDLTGRVAGLLLRLADEETNLIEGYAHQDLASMVGCLRESVTVALDRFKQSDAISIGRKRIEITDRAQLERVVSQRSANAV